ncbi:hypothetical protein [Streptomyces nigrescens]|uniref:Uncharacterized protein n=1 Tax=Streptomyces nigrescens TaxID=1920 RepID=A0A640T8L6_STRNI|nr:hypothetical protein [Streptomyces libani]WAT94948.1 hypothetical protein STRLI_000620 [Streptomyces libani subsp. libani]GFE20097.1 hypothetical protein Sliba_05500 [Streptomyces libani subsp. libani]GGV85859.1 hypothetical protein GCM10010500_03030 [Streptomyces libani subsp. libani]
MEVLAIAPDGAITVRITAAEAAEVRGDLTGLRRTGISAAGDYLAGLLDFAQPRPGSRVRFGATEGLDHNATTSKEQ